MERNRQDVIRAASRSIWRERFTKNFSFYCPMCTAPRRIGMHPKPGQPIHFAQVGITAILIGALSANFLPWIGWKAIVSFVPLWMAFETFYRAKIRASVACRKCGFDPVLYLSDTDRARTAVREHWRKKFEEKGIPFPEEGARNNASHLQGAATKPAAVNAPSPKKLGNSSRLKGRLDSAEK